uniref:EP300-interacting inhibitor of differentiation 3 isoform X2 n=1 Tax=Jaculus jaculus TaxID=51337 RepID=UPI001E1B0A37|nr:EP300-interacting inhibitor of differentiation 3 isoform X2 [Jaculus jaculus]
MADENNSLKEEEEKVKPEYGAVACEGVEVKLDEMKPDEMKPVEVKPDEMKPVEMKPVEVKLDEMKPDEMKPVEVKPVEVKPDEMKPVEVKLDEVKPVEVKLDEVKPVEVKADKVKADEEKPAEEKRAEEDEEWMKMEVEMGADSYSEDVSSEEPELDLSLLELTVDREKCRHIRRQYRQLIYTVQQHREDIVNTASDTLTEALEEANVLFDGVSRTREAALDAQFLVLASDLGKEKAKQLNSDMNSFNYVAFCDLLFSFVGLNWIEDEFEELSDCGDSVALSFWEAVHKESMCWIKQAETFHFIFGSFKAEPSTRKRRLEYKRAHKMEENGDMPTKLRKLDVHANQETTEKEVERILGLLQTYFQKYPDTPVSYFEFVIDPHSFSRTVENIFYVSFIIRDGFARIRLDQDRLPVLEPTNINKVDEDTDASSYSRKQGVISLSLQDWKNIVSTFEISEAMIKNTY